MLLRYLIKGLLLPPSLNIILLLLGILLFQRKKRTGSALIIISTLLLTTFSLPVFGRYLASPSRCRKKGAVRSPLGSRIRKWLDCRIQKDCEETGFPVKRLTSPNDLLLFVNACAVHLKTRQYRCHKKNNK